MSALPAWTAVQEDQEILSRKLKFEIFLALSGRSDHESGALVSRDRFPDGSSIKFIWPSAQT